MRVQEAVAARGPDRWLSLPSHASRAGRLESASIRRRERLAQSVPRTPAARCCMACWRMLRRTSVLSASSLRAASASRLAFPSQLAVDGLRSSTRTAAPTCEGAHGLGQRRGARCSRDRSACERRTWSAAAALLACCRARRSRARSGAASSQRCTRSLFLATAARSWARRLDIAARRSESPCGAVGHTGTRALFALLGRPASRESQSLARRRRPGGWTGEPEGKSQEQHDELGTVDPMKKGSSLRAPGVRMGDRVRRIVLLRLVRLRDASLSLLTFGFGLDWYPAA